MSISPTRSFKVRSKKDRLYEVLLTSTATGYSARVKELIYGGSWRFLGLRYPVRYEFHPGEFFKMRKHFRGLLVGQITAELTHDHVDEVRTDIERQDSFIRANLVGWPNVYPDVIDDDMADWVEL